MWFVSVKSNWLTNFITICFYQTLDSDPSDMGDMSPTSPQKQMKRPLATYAKQTTLKSPEYFLQTNDSDFVHRDLFPPKTVLPTSDLSCDVPISNYSNNNNSFLASSSSSSKRPSSVITCSSSKSSSGSSDRLSPSSNEEYFEKNSDTQVNFFILIVK